MDSPRRSTDIPMALQRLLSLDIGISTGWATFVGGELTDHGVVSDYLLDRFCKEQAERHWDYIIGEEPVIIRGQLGDALSRTVFIIKHRLPQVELFYATAWKGTKHGQEKVKKGISAHERDAIRFGIWYRKTILKTPT